MTGTRYGLEILHQCNKWVETKIEKILGLIPTFLEATGKKLVGGPFLPSILNRVINVLQFFYMIFSET